MLVKPVYFFLLLNRLLVGWLQVLVLTNVHSTQKIL